MKYISKIKRKVDDIRLFNCILLLNIPIIIMILSMIIVFSNSCSPIHSSMQNLLNSYRGLRTETIKLEYSEISNSYPRLVCLGDSVTFGWNLSYEKSFPNLLEKKLMERYPESMVINSGIGGETVIDALSRLEYDVFYYKPQIVIINFGLNDALILTNRNLREDSSTYLENNIDLHTYRATYKKIIRKILEKDIEILVMSTNPVISELFWENEDIAKKQEESYLLYNIAVEEIAEEYDIVFVDIWESFMSTGELENLIQPDGIHPSMSGQEYISELVIDALKTVDLFKR